MTWFSHFESLSGAVNGVERVLSEPSFLIDSESLQSLEAALMQSEATAWVPLSCITCPPPCSPFYPNISSFISELILSLWEHSRGKGVQKGLISEPLSLGTIGPRLLCSQNSYSSEWPWVCAYVATDSVTWPLVASMDRNKERRSLHVGKWNICN